MHAAKIIYLRQSLAVKLIVTPAHDAQVKH